MVNSLPDYNNSEERVLFDQILPNYDIMFNETTFDVLFDDVEIEDEQE